MSIHRSPILREHASWDDTFSDEQLAGWICTSELRQRLNIPKKARIRIVASTERTTDAFRVHIDPNDKMYWRIDRRKYYLLATPHRWLHSLPADTLWCWVEIEP